MRRLEVQALNRTQRNQLRVVAWPPLSRTTSVQTQVASATIICALGIASSQSHAKMAVAQLAVEFIVKRVPVEQGFTTSTRIV
jgi:diketogulonate reductase-like aldo/keto reductase